MDRRMSKEEELRLTKPFFALFHDPNFQVWVKGIERGLDGLKESFFTLNFQALDAYQEKTLREWMGLKPPESSEEVLQALIAVRTVYTYLRSTLDELKRKADRHEQLKKELSNG